MSKKFVAGGLVLGAVLVGAFGMFQIPAVKAAVLSVEVLDSVNILGIGVLSSGNYQLRISDMSGASGNQTVSLPALSGNDGMVFTVKQINSSSPHTTVVTPASGDSIDAALNQTWQLEDSGEYVQLIADEARDTWWVVSGGNFPY